MRRTAPARPRGSRSALPGLAVPFAALLLAAGAAPRADAAGNDLTGRPAPEITVSQGLNGLPAGATLSSLRGRVVVLKFFFVGCPTCRTSLPAFQDLHLRYAPMGVHFIAIAYDDRATVEGYLARGGFTFPVAIDPYGATPARYGVRTYPTHYVIGADGVVAAYDTLSPAVLDRALALARAKANEDELGAVPAALAGVAAAARANDYGLVLRLVEPRLDPARDPADVVAAAARIRSVARNRFDRRVARVRARFDAGDRAGALREARAVVSDFRDTSAFPAARELEKDLEQRAGGARLATR
jgi:peroxiredoxin